MPFYVGLDASKATTSICVIDELGDRIEELVVETTPRAVVAALRGHGRRYRRVGLESMSMASWLYEGLAKAGLPVICIEARHARGVMKARVNKTDRNDAQGIAEMMRTGGYKAVHVKTTASQEAKLVLTARRHLVRSRRNLDNLVRGFLLQFGLKLEPGQLRTFEIRAQKLVQRPSALRDVVRRLLSVRRAIQAEVAALEDVVTQLVDADPVCRRLMTAPGVGPIVALAYRAAIDLPGRFPRSRTVAVHLGLTHGSIRSGTIKLGGRISRRGDESARSALYLAAQSVLRTRTRATRLGEWGVKVKNTRGGGKAVVAVARRLAVILHRMWTDGTDFREQAAS
jgi:transposase